MADQLMYVKEDLILPHHYTFYDFIVTKVKIFNNKAYQAITQCWYLILICNTLMLQLGTRKKWAFVHI